MYIIYHTADCASVVSSPGTFHLCVKDKCIHMFTHLFGTGEYRCFPLEEIAPMIFSTPQGCLVGYKGDYCLPGILFQLDDPVLCQIRDEILNLDVNNLTPLEALNKLSDIKRIVRGK